MAETGETTDRHRTNQTGHFLRNRQPAQLLAYPVELGADLNEPVPCFRIHFEIPQSMMAPTPAH
jgi:hypothetical protein